MTTFRDWLWNIPIAENPTEQRAILDGLIQADQAAASIPDEEVERFYSVATVLRNLEIRAQKATFARFGFHITQMTQVKERQGIRWVLRQWRKREHKEILLQGLYQIGFEGYQGAKAGRDYWTDERFSHAYHYSKVEVIWLAYVARELGVMSDAAFWFDRIGGKDAVFIYRFWLDIGRLAMRRLLYPDMDAAQTAAASALATHEEISELAVKERKTSALRQDVRRLEQDRKRLKEQNRRLTQEQKEELSRARGEVAAAERGLKELRVAQRGALAEQERRFEREKAAIEKQISEARAAYAQSLREQRVVPVLAGRVVHVSGAAGHDAAARAQVETLGARFVPDPTTGAGANRTITVDGSKGYADLERQLRTLALGDIHIKCDGNWRKKMGRFGISNAAFEVLLGERSIYQEGRPVCCGPLTSPVMSEYAAIIMALNWVLRARPVPGSSVLIWSDCKFLVDHINGRKALARTRGCVTLDITLSRLLRQVKRLGYQVAVRWVPRANVHHMDRLCAATYYCAAWYHRWKKGERVPTLPLEQFLQTI